MTLPAAPNSISMSQMNTEISRSSNAQLSMSDSTVNSIISNTPGTEISFNELRGQSYFTANIAPASIESLLSPSPAATCTAVGGSGSRTFSWARISGDSRITADSPSSASTTFTRTGFAAGESAAAVFRCTVTDTVTSAVATDDITVTLERPSGG